MGWVSVVDSRGPKSLKEHRKVENLEATVACLAATLKEQAAQIHKTNALSLKRANLRRQWSTIRKAHYRRAITPFVGDSRIAPA
ncbi:MAG: hypothetical protein DMG62_25140 [Acidobacteria bacterium]|nr:MAG: hypothetical protein DMG62_25140 [Acidobacteriota bacterium]